MLIIKLASNFLQSYLNFKDVFYYYVLLACNPTTQKRATLSPPSSASLVNHKALILTAVCQVWFIADCRNLNSVSAVLPEVTGLGSAILKAIRQAQKLDQSWSIL